MSVTRLPPLFREALRTPETYAELIEPLEGERVSFAWDAETDTVTIKCYCPKGFMDQKSTLPRKAARSFWNDLISIDGFTHNV